MIARLDDQSRGLIDLIYRIALMDANCQPVNPQPYPIACYHDRRESNRHAVERKPEGSRSQNSEGEVLICIETSPVTIA